MFKKLLLISSLVCLCACSSGKRVSCPPPHETVSVAQVCDALSAPLCRRLSDCEYTDMPHKECMAAFRATCCSISTNEKLSGRPYCGKRVDASHKDLDQCSTDIMMMSCHDIALIPDKTANIMPLSCTTL